MVLINADGTDATTHEFARCLTTAQVAIDVDCKVGVRASLRLRLHWPA